MKLLKLNQFQLFHQRASDTVTAGAITTNLNADFINSIGDMGLLLDQFGPNLQTLPPLSYYGKWTVSRFCLVQMTALGQYLLDYPSDQSVNLKKQPTCTTVTSPSATIPDPAAKKPKTKVGQKWSCAIIWLLLCTTNDDFLVYMLGNISNFVYKGFDDTKHCSSKQYHQFCCSKLESVFSSYDSLVFQDLVLIPKTKGHMSAIYKGSLSTKQTKLEHKGSISLGCFNPPTKSEMEKLENKENDALMDQLLLQAP